jgi:hypothetical protein
VAWDLRLPLHTLPRTPRPGDDDDDFFGNQSGPYAIPGAYSVSMAQRVGGVVTPLGGPVSFKVFADPNSPLTAADHKARGEFQVVYQSLRRSVAGAIETANATSARLDQLKRALDGAPKAPRALHDSVRAIEKRLGAILIALRGDTAIARRSEATADSISDRVNFIGFEQSRTLAPATGTHRRQVEIAKRSSPRNSRSSRVWSKPTSPRSSAKPRRRARRGRRAASRRCASRDSELRSSRRANNIAP